MCPLANALWYFFGWLWGVLARASIPSLVRRVECHILPGGGSKRKRQSYDDHFIVIITVDARQVGYAYIKQLVDCL